MHTAFTFNSTWTPGFHIGAARILLANWASAVKNNGKISLFCDDLAKPFSKTTASIYDMVNWLGGDMPLGLNCDGPYYNFHSRQDYKQAVDRLLAEGWAYYDYATPDEIHQEQGKDNFIYSRKWAASTEEDCKKFEAEGRKPVVRLKMPRTTETLLWIEEHILEDQLNGLKKYELSTAHDYVIQQADGGYTSYLTMPVNYHLHGIDFIYVDWRHWQSIPAQLFIARRLGFQLPRMAHIPYLTESNGTRRFTHRRHEHHMKDRDFSHLYDHGQRIDAEIAKVINYGPFSPCYIDFYRRIGFLPATLRHYLLGSIMRAGSSLTIPAPFSHEKHLAAAFHSEDIKKSPVAFNPALLWNMQRQYMAGYEVEKKCWLINSYLNEIKLSNYRRNAFKSVPEDLLGFVKGISSKLVCAGDIITLADHYDEGLGVR